MRRKMREKGVKQEITKEYEKENGGKGGQLRNKRQKGGTRRK